MKIRKGVGRILLGVVLAYLVLSGNRGLWNLYQLHQEKRELTGEIARLRDEVGKYRAAYDAYERNTSVVERQAREELNLVRPGERIYRFRGEEAR